LDSLNGRQCCFWIDDAIGAVEFSPSHKDKNHSRKYGKET
jgi:hypothetical protein